MTENSLEEDAMNNSVFPSVVDEDVQSSDIYKQKISGYHDTP
jgi:hypothetical protein